MNFRFCCVETVVKTSKPYASAMRIAIKIKMKSKCYEFPNELEFG